MRRKEMQQRQHNPDHSKLPFPHLLLFGITSLNINKYIFSLSGNKLIKKFRKIENILC